MVLPYIIATLISSDLVHNKIKVKSFINPILIENKISRPTKNYYITDYECEVFKIYNSLKVKRGEPYKRYKKFYRVICRLENYKIHKFVPRGNKRPRDN